MPKRHGNLFSKCFTPDAIHAAYLAARKGKRRKKAVLEFERNLGSNLQRLHDEVHSWRYEPRPYTTFMVHEPKPRLIYAPNFRDVVIQHAIYAVIYPLFDAGFIHDNYGCRVGKGTHSAADQAQKFLRAAPDDSFTLQMDIRKFFYRIDRDRLMELVSRKIKDRGLLVLLRMFTRYPDKTGIPIGNLLSQLFALIYLNPLDHFAKRELGCKHYVRYVDDFIVFGLPSREAANALRERFGNFIRDELHLEFSRYTIAPTKRGLNFVGFRTWRRVRYVRRHSLHTFSRSMRRGKMHSLISVTGNARHSATYSHFFRRLNAERQDLVSQLPESHRHACTNLQIHPGC